ncbi:hypothetical protein GS4_08_01590 [Gordonia soli NBRC 108243]|uniref:EamA domain-containing protein n=1 Tax=Gordonia soli NBRC 108243 TaxID=1223545 RepID=M0QGJ8_9ACTN|nr:hypothetical protein GS4_08_01590 [Gordonia soli NBRC 108243]
MIGLLAVTFVICWSSGFIGAKLGAADAPVPTVLMWRFLPLAAIAVPVILVWCRRRVRPMSRSEWGRQVLIGLLSQAAYVVTVYWAIGMGVSTGTTALVDGVQPLVAAALVGPLLGAVVTRGQWVGLALGLFGVAVVSWTDATSAAGRTPLWAYVIPLAGMAALLASTFIERRAPRSVPASVAVSIHCCVSAVVFTGLALATGTASPPASGRFWIAMVWLIVFATLGGYGLYWFLLARIGVTPVNSLMFAIAPVTAVWGAVMFDEPLTATTVVGLGLAIAAALIAGRRERSERARLVRRRRRERRERADVTGRRERRERADVTGRRERSERAEVTERDPPAAGGQASGSGPSDGRGVVGVSSGAASGRPN